MQKYRHETKPEPSNGGLYACSCGVRHVTLEQIREHEKNIALYRLESK